MMFAITLFLICAPAAQSSKVGVSTVDEFRRKLMTVHETAALAQKVKQLNEEATVLQGLNYINEEKESGVVLPCRLAGKLDISALAILSLSGLFSVFLIYRSVWKNYTLMKVAKDAASQTRTGTASFVCTRGYEHVELQPAKSKTQVN